MVIPELFKVKQLRKGNLGSIEQDEFLEIIMAFIHCAGGQASRQEIISTIHDVYSHQFTDSDYKLLTSQTPPKERWIHNIDWAKRKLVQQGLLLKPAESPYGVWVISDAGKTRANNIAMG